jgi:iron complex outermembrane recepter protein
MRSMAKISMKLVSATALALALVSPAVAQDAVQDETATAEDQTTGQDIVVTGKFVDEGASSATKLDLNVLDTPFSVNAYNANFLKAIETSNVSDLYRYMTGIQRAGNTGYDISFRGFKTSGNDRNAILTDGLPGLSVRFGSPPTIGTDHIELVKGATSVLYGQAQPGGFINIITKKPKFSPGYEVTLKGTAGVGSYDRARGGLFQLDLTGPVEGSNAVAGRFVGEGGYTRGFRDFSYEKPIFAAPSLTWRPGDSTEITAQGEYRWVKTHLDTFLVAPLRDVTKIATINTTYQEPDDYLIERGTTGSIFASHEFSKDIKFNVGYRYVDHLDTQRNYDVVGFRDTANTILTRRARAQENKRTYSFVDANSIVKLETFGLRHTFLVGVSAGRETASLNRLQFFNCTGTGATGCNSLDVAVNNPIHGRAPALGTFPLFNTGQPANLNWRYTTQKSFGVYGSDFIEITDFLKVMAGLRYANEKQTIEDKRITTFVPVRKKDTKTLPFGGVIVQPIEGVSLYASYSTSFVPVPAAQQDVFGLNPFVPTSAKAYEVGFKTDLFDHRLNLTGAWFDIKKRNTINTFSCPTNLAGLNAFITANGITVPANAPRDTAGNLVPGSGTCSNQLGGERSKGFEIELNATPLDNWTISAGFSHLNPRVTSSNVPGQTGALLTNAPRNAFNMWTRYDFKEGALKDLGVGVGVAYIGKRAGLLPTALVDTRPAGGTLPLASYTTIDAGLYYALSDTLDLTLKGSNLLDERFIESAGFTGDLQLVPGTPRTLTVTLRARY